MTNPALAAEKHPSHDHRVATIIAPDHTHICATSAELLAVLLREVLEMREAA